MRMPFYRAVLLRGVSHRAMVTALAHGHDPRKAVLVRAPEVKSLDDILGAPHAA